MRQLKPKFRFLLLWMLLVLPMTLRAEIIYFEEGYLNYMIDTDTMSAEVCGLGSYNWYDKGLTIPDYVNFNEEQIPVTSIASEAFMNTGLSGSLTIADSVTIIGDYAFYGCSSLTGSLTIGAYHIGDYAFYGCSGFDGELLLEDTV